MNIFRLFLKKKNNENMLHNAPNCTIQKSLWVKHAPEPPSKRLIIVVHALRHTTCSAPQKVGPPWQILHTPMDYYQEIYLRRCARRIHSGKQLIVCITLYVYALQGLFKGQK